MRAPGFLGWDREEEFMDWREVSRKGQGSSSAASGNLVAGTQSSSTARSMRPRRRSRTREQGCTFEHRREETRSIDRLECNSSNVNRRRTADTAMDAGHAVMKSRSTSSVGTWKPTELLDTETNGSDDHPSSLASDECRAGEVNRCAKVVSPMTMEKWKETARCETRSRALAPGDLKTPLRLDEAVLGQRQDGNAENRLQNSQRNVDDVGDDELPAFIGNLLVSVERKIERVSLDDLTFPCPACRNIDIDDPLLGCRCAGDDCTCSNGEDACDCSSSAANPRKEQSTTRSFEIAGIKHIDSDDEEEVRMGFGE